jgi:hypothetical protein
MKTKESNCQECGKPFISKWRQTKDGWTKYCSKECIALAKRKRFSGENNPAWRGGVVLRKDGYVEISIGNGEYRLEHDLIMEEIIGRRLLENEIVHHINKNRSDNKPENLQLSTFSGHGKIHAIGKDPEKWKLCECLYCKKPFYKRTCRLKTNPNSFCSRECCEKGIGELLANQK